MNDREKDDVVDNINYHIKAIDTMEQFINGFNLMLNRYENTKDPILRYSLILDKFIMAVELTRPLAASALLDNFNLGRRSIEIINDLSEDDKLKILYESLKSQKIQLNDKLQNLFNLLNKQLYMINDFIQKDLYNPDHLLGSQLLSEAKSDFVQHSSNNK